jgi:hypothetical protein
MTGMDPPEGTAAWWPDGPTPGAQNLVHGIVRRVVSVAFGVFAGCMVVAVGIPMLLLWRDAREDQRDACLRRVDFLTAIDAAFDAEHDALSEAITGSVSDDERDRIIGLLQDRVHAALPTQDPDDCPTSRP